MDLKDLRQSNLTSVVRDVLNQNKDIVGDSIKEKYKQYDTSNQPKENDNEQKS